MGKRLLSLFLAVVLFGSTPFYISTKALEITKSLNKTKIIEKLNALSQGKLKISKENGQVFISGKLSEEGLVNGAYEHINEAEAKEIATKFLNENKALFGIDSISEALKFVEVETDSLGHTYAKYVQVIEGIEVEGSLINVHFDENGVIESVNGNFYENNDVTTLGSSKISESEAIEIAKSKYTFESLRETPKVENVILSQDAINYEVYKVNVSFFGSTIGNYDVFVEAYSGEIIKTENKIRTDGPVAGTGIDVGGHLRNVNLYQVGTVYQMHDVTKNSASAITAYTMNNGTLFGDVVINSTTSFNSEVHKASVSANYNASKVIDFYKNLFNRNSLDNNGMAIDSFTHYGNKYNNAFWTGYEMVYGDGDGTLFTYLSGDLDVVGHEMTHGVIEHTANLNYHNESGALNESIADVFGVLISTYDKYNVAAGGYWTFNTADWVIGDDIYTPYIPGDALRSLSNPKLNGQPDHMNGFVGSPDTEVGDYGGVHSNSGILNKAAYNIAQSIGMEKTSKVYYRALVNYMIQSTDFQGARASLMQAATDLYGGNSTETIAIGNAFNSVGIVDPAISLPVAVTGVTLDKNSANLKVGQTISLVATVSPANADNKNVAWTSSNTSVVTVDTTGKVTSVGAGTGTITATTKDGSKTATCTVTVVKPVTGVSLDKSTVTVKSGEATTLIVNVEPQDASNKNVTWTSSNTSVATVDSIGKVTAVSAGTATVSAVTADGGYRAECTITVISPVAPAPPAPIKTTTRLGGANRIETSTKIADSFREGSKLNGVILASAGDFPDALAGGVLTKKYNAPILLVNKTAAASKSTIDYIKNNVNKDAQIVILGATGVIDGSVVNTLKDAGFTKIKRLGGSDRFATNMAIINDFNPTVGSDVIVSYSNNFPDALSISSVSAAQGMPILLVNKNLTAEQKNMLATVKPSNIYITGGSGVISNSIENELKNYSSSVVRLAGANRYETSKTINNRFKSVLTGSNALLASGLDFPDALSGTALALKLNAPIILVNSQDTSLQREFISSNNKSNVYILGGSGAVSDTSVQSITW